MDTTSRARRAFTPQERQQYVERFRRSGLSQAEFCRRAKLHPMTFSLWRRQAQEAAPVFAEVQVAAPMPGATATLHLAHGVKLEVPVGAAAAWHGLGLLLKSLQS
jgi:transposase-like protein